MKPPIEAMLTMLPFPWLEHLPAEALTGQERALQVERHDGVEPILRELLGGAAEGGARAVDEHVDAAEPGDHIRDDAVDGRRVGDVRGERSGRAARVGDRGTHFGRALCVDVDDGDRCTRLREAGGDRGAEPARSADDDCDAVLEAEEACDKSVWERCRHHAAVIGVDRRDEVVDCRQHVTLERGRVRDRRVLRRDAGRCGAERVDAHRLDHARDDLGRVARP